MTDLAPNNRRIRNVALVSQPWSHVARPAAAIGTLSAYLSRELPLVEINSHYNYIDVALSVGPRFYDHVSKDCYEMGEVLYLPLLYPEKRDSAADSVVKRLLKHLPDADPAAFLDGATEWLDVVQHAIDVLADEVSRLADVLAAQADLVGLTTCFGQVFANVALARAIKARDPEIQIVLGGSSVSDRAGPSMLREYPSIDFIVQGEGERPFVELIERLNTDPSRLDFDKGVLSRQGTNSPTGVPLLEVEVLDDLPFPDYAAYAAAAKRHGINWDVPIEGSRGCWWDRVKRTGNPKSTCYFCNLNVQWNGYRQKSEDRVIEEVRVLSDRYANGRIFFLDNIIRHKGLDELAGGLKALDQDLEIFYEMRANVRPNQLLALWQAGLREVQIGVEGLSSSLLKRIGKGTTTIQNLEAMKICFELGIANNSNLMLEFPTSTTAEVTETVDMIERFAICYEPLHITVFELGIGATAEVLAESFGVRNISTAKPYLNAMPKPVWKRLQVLSGLSFEQDEKVDWQPVLDAVERWKQRHTRIEKPLDRLLLSYEDGGSYLRIRDRRGRHRDHTLRGLDREIYLHCCQIRSRSEIRKRFATSAALAKRVENFLEAMTTRDLMFSENDKFLSIATARDAAAAQRRIERTQHHALATPLRRVSL